MTKRKRNSAGPTLTDIARRLDISAVAVGLAINGKPGIGDDLRKRILDLAAEMGYRPNLAARALRTGDSGMIGVINRNLHNPGFPQVIEGLDTVCQRHGFHVMVGSSRWDADRELALVNSFASRGIDGLAIVAVDPEGVAALWEQVGGGGPLAILQAEAPVDHPRVFSIRAESERPVREAASYVAGLGHSRIALMAGTEERTSGAAREEAFTDEVRARGGEPLLLRVGWSLEEAHANLIPILSGPDRPTAIIANSDRLGMAVYLAAKDCGLRVPEDLSVIGHDDIEAARILDPAMTTFSVDQTAVGELAAARLISMVKGEERGERDVTVASTLIRRESTAPPQGAASPLVP